MAFEVISDNDGSPAGSFGRSYSNFIYDGSNKPKSMFYLFRIDSVKLLLVPNVRRIFIFLDPFAGQVPAVKPFAVLILDIQDRMRYPGRNFGRPPPKATSSPSPYLNSSSCSRNIRKLCVICLLPPIADVPVRFPISIRRVCITCRRVSRASGELSKRRRSIFLASSAYSSSVLVSCPATVR